MVFDPGYAPAYRNFDVCIFLLHLRVLLFGEIKRYKSPIRIISLHTCLRLITGLDLPTNISNRPIHRPFTLGIFLTSLSLTPGLLLPALTIHQPANQLLSISSLLTGLRLITGPVLHLLTNNRPPFISSPLNSLRLLTHLTCTGLAITRNYPDSPCQLQVQVSLSQDTLRH